ncbi:MAG TPA: hypothetical protein PLJ26_02320 [Candidatus Omnitrophota bacterium]|nr:hypothetical protein [Candidatus Omnitrophota bacterium]HQJ15308.1 hypothetical protein [Candidatus Omnitrophota bacterium]
MSARLRYAVILAFSVSLLPVSHPGAASHAFAQYQRIVTGRVTGVHPDYIVVKQIKRSRVYVYRFFIDKDTVIQGTIVPGTEVAVEYRSVRRPNRKHKYIARNISIIR